MRAGPVATAVSAHRRGRLWIQVEDPVRLLPSPRADLSKLSLDFEPADGPRVGCVGRRVPPPPPRLTLLPLLLPLPLPSPQPETLALLGLALLTWFLASASLSALAGHPVRHAREGNREPLGLFT